MLSRDTISGMKRLFLLSGIVLAVVLAGLAAVRPPAADRHAPPADGVLVVGMTQYPSTLHPLFDSMLAKSYVLGASLRPMTAHDVAWRPQCILCETLPSLENGLAEKVTLPDGRQGIRVRYRLKENLFWADGTPLTAADFRLAYDIGRHPQAGVGNHHFYAVDIADLHTPDARTVEITFAREACDFAAIDDFVPLPDHLERALFEADPKTYAHRSLYVTAPETPGLWMGPYRVSAAAPGSRIDLARNAYWRGDAPDLAGLRLRVIENTSAMASNLLAGRIHYIAGELGLPLDQAIGFEKRLPPGAFVAVSRPGLVYEHMDLPFAGPWADRRLRQALMLSMDREAINRFLFSGRQPPAKSGINPLDAGYSEDVRGYAYDPAAAAALFDAAGWRLGADGRRYNAAGDALRLTLSTTAGNATRELVQQAIQSFFRAAGVETSLRNEPPRVLFGETLTRRRFTGGVIYAWLSVPGGIPRTSLHSSMVPTAENGYAGQNYVGYANPHMDRVLDDLRTTCTPAARQALWRALQEIYADDLPSLPLYHRAEMFLIPRWLENIRPTGHLHPTTLWVESWRIRRQ